MNHSSLSEGTKFSLCIATMNRFDEFLSKNLPKYLENALIAEIVVSDENGNDVAKIRDAFGEHPKLRLYKNNTQLGPFLNKLQACSHANNEWIVLMDSDNFADVDYFIAAKAYLESHIGDQKNIILAPSDASSNDKWPNLNFSHLSGFVYKHGTFAENKKREYQVKQTNLPSTILANTGNYVINKYLIDNVNIQPELQNIHLSPTCDVVFFNTLLFEQLDLNMHVVPTMKYEHVVHDNSIYIQKHAQYWQFNESIYSRFNSLQ